MMRWIAFFAAMAAFAPGDSARADNSASEPPAEERVIVAAGEPTGVFLPEAGAICRIINKELRRPNNILCLIEPTAGSIANIALLRNKGANAAIVQSNAAVAAAAGEGVFKEAGAFEGLRGLFSLHGESILILVHNESKIDDPADLKGKKVNLGPEGGFQRFMSNAALEALGLGGADLSEALEFDPVRQTEALCNHGIDAAIYSGVHPIAEAEEALGQCDVHPLLLDEGVLSAYVDANKTFSKIAIAPGLYQGIDQPIQTFGPRALFVATTNMSADSAYLLVKAIFDNHDSFRAMHPLLSDLDKKQMTSGTNAIPLHDGAQKYYQEQKRP
ncbi:C4-dicarboxylate ABC transporter substrate-binding protein [Alphaproteobacteria bacterium]|nr:C4-dicarboxylate ABC transporter substrate-binding protein [Alphaproteobacteria bacterium]